MRTKVLCVGTFRRAHPREVYVGDSLKGPLNNQGKPRLKPAKKNANTNQLTHLTRIHSTTAILVAPAARQDDAADAPRVKSASLEG
jgi:hypothetical protein